MKNVLERYAPIMLMVVAMILGQELAYWVTEIIEPIAFASLGWLRGIWVITGGVLAVISGFFCLRIFYTDYARKSVGLSILSKEMFVFAIFGFEIGMFFMGL